MSPHSERRGADKGIHVRAPMKPVQPRSFDLAVPPEHDLESDAVLCAVSFVSLDLSGRSAELMELRQSRFTDADLSDTTFDRVVLTDCVFHKVNLANLRARKSSMVRGELSASRMTGFQWIEGLLRDVRIIESRINLSSFRFTKLTSVVFDRCDLVGADFVNADLSAAEFIGCDLTGAQFSHARMRGARFADCVLADIAGITSWAGAIVRSHDLVTLSYTLAAALDIRIEGDD